MARSMPKFSVKLKAAVLVVSGWPFGMPGDIQQGIIPSPEDAAFGRLACPSLTRLNLQQQKSEPLLLRSVELESPKQWKLTLKSDLHWWSGKAVSSSDLETFLREQICPTVASALGKEVPCPTFDVTSADPSQGANKGQPLVVNVTWHAQPEFGPYILNNTAFFRRTGNQAIECAGLYRYRSVGLGEAEFIPAPGYPQKRPTLRIYEPRNANKNLRPQVAFTFASGMQPKQTCSREALLPTVVGILWSDSGEGVLATSPQARKALTQILPRGELLRAGARGLGELVTSFIPRQHPGYNHALRIRPYNVDDASAAMEKIGWQRAMAEASRIDRKTSKPVVLRFLIQDMDAEGGDLLQKVIGDSFALLGIQTEFISGATVESNKPNEPNEPKPIDGIIGSFATEWPAVSPFQADYPNRLFQQFTKSNFYRHPDNQRLARIYAQSLTTGTPDFASLQSFHEKLYDAEVFSPIFQMGTCLDRSATAPAKLDFTDPDWLRLLVL